MISSSYGNSRHRSLLRPHLHHAGEFSTDSHAHQDNFIWRSIVLDCSNLRNSFQPGLLFHQLGASESTHPSQCTSSRPCSSILQQCACYCSQLSNHYVRKRHHALWCNLQTSLRITFIATSSEFHGGVSLSSSRAYMCHYVKLTSTADGFSFERPER